MNKDFGYILVFVLFAIVSVLIYIGTLGNKEDQARRVLTNDGITVTSLGMGMFGCSESDSFNFKFEGVNDKGVKVEGRVCSGLLKGATIRYD